MQEPMALHFFMLVPASSARRALSEAVISYSRARISIGIGDIELTRFLILLTGCDGYRQRLNIELLLVIIAVCIEHVAHHHAVAVIIIVIGDELSVIPKGVKERFGNAAVFQIVIAAEGLIVDVNRTPRRSSFMAATRGCFAQMALKLLARLVLYRSCTL